MGDALMEIVVRATVIFFFLWLLTRALGKRELAEMSAFELVLLVVVGDLIQQGVTQEDYSLTGAMLAAGTIGIWVLVFGYISFKSKKLQPLLEGVPVVVVRDGQPIQAAMAIERVDIAEVKEAARNQGIADLSEVRCGVLEPDGRFSFIKVDGRQEQPVEKHTAAS
jgi:uncharacterized membrane protein YcaP (DUF421 family)